MRGDGGRIPVGVLGATGSVGQRFVTLLADHPWFRPAFLAASERSAGRPYREAVAWSQTAPLPSGVGAAEVRTLEEVPSPDRVPLLFSALDASVAGPAETGLAGEGHLVVSNARSHRMDPTVPLLVPEVNPDHLRLLEHQGYPRGGGLITNPNCSTIGLTMALAPLHRRFGLDGVQVVTLQALSGAGLPGPGALSMTDNVVPYIPGEEEKLEREPHKILGRLDAHGVEPADFPVSAQCTRVAVSDGHLACVSVSMERRAKARAVRDAWDAWRGEPQELGLPSAPERPVRYLEAPDAPQPRLHRDLDGGMAVSVGRLRPDPLLDLRFVCLSHNTVRGAAGGALLCGELAASRGLVPGREARR